MTTTPPPESTEPRECPMCHVVGGHGPVPHPVFGSDKPLRCPNEAIDAVRYTRVQARLQMAALRALAAEMLNLFVEPGHPGFPACRTGWVPKRTLDRWRALLAGAGEQPGEVWIGRCAIHDGDRDDTCRICAAEGTIVPAPVVPDSTPLRDEDWWAVNAMAVDLAVDPEAIDWAEVSVREQEKYRALGRLARGVLAVVSQGVTAEHQIVGVGHSTQHGVYVTCACTGDDTGYGDGTPIPADTYVSEHLAVVRSGQQEGRADG